MCVWGRGIADGSDCELSCKWVNSLLAPSAGAMAPPLADRCRPVHVQKWTDCGMAIDSSLRRLGSSNIVETVVVWNNQLDAGQFLSCGAHD